MLDLYQNSLKCYIPLGHAMLRKHAADSCGNLLEKSPNVLKERLKISILRPSEHKCDKSSSTAQYASSVCLIGLSEPLLEDS